MPDTIDHPFTSGELVLHHRYAPSTPITCGEPSGCVTEMVGDVRCPGCLAALQEETRNLGPEDPFGEAFDLFENLRPGSTA